MTSPEINWIDEGLPLDALSAMLSKPDVLIDDFHAVYARLLSEPNMLLEQPGIRPFMEQTMCGQGQWEDALFKEGKMPTASETERFQAPEIAGYRPEEITLWILENRSMSDRLKNAEELLELSQYDDFIGGRMLI